MTDRMPVKRPSLPTGSSVHHLVGFGQDPRGEKVVWLLFASDSDLEAWFNSITQTLPKRPQEAGQPPPGQPSSGQPNQPTPMATQNQGWQPPTQYPPAPRSYQPHPAPPAYNSIGPSPQANQPYYPPPQSTHTTVIVDRDRPSYGNSGSYGGAFGGGGSSGLGFGSGALLGGLLGYGIGSFFTPHYSSGFGGFGLGHGFGGSYAGGYPMGGGSVQDNDTTTYNNVTVSTTSMFFTCALSEQLLQYNRFKQRLFVFRKR